jgi:hypothetical protein
LGLFSFTLLSGIHDCLNVWSRQHRLHSVAHINIQIVVHS